VGGDVKGTAAWSRGKGLEYSDAYDKAINGFRRNLLTIPLVNYGGLAYDVEGRHNNIKVKIMSRMPGTGLRAGNLAWEILRCFGIEDATCKVYGRGTPYSVVYAIWDALRKLRSNREIALGRGMHLYKLPEPADRRLNVPTQKEIHLQEQRVEEIIQSIKDEQAYRDFVDRNVAIDKHYFTPLLVDAVNGIEVSANEQCGTGAPLADLDPEKMADPTEGTDEDEPSVTVEDGFGDPQYYDGLDAQVELVKNDDNQIERRYIIQHNDNDIRRFLKYAPDPLRRPEQRLNEGLPVAIPPSILAKVEQMQAEAEAAAEDGSNSKAGSGSGSAPLPLSSRASASDVGSAQPSGGASNFHFSDLTDEQVLELQQRQQLAQQRHAEDYEYDFDEASEHQHQQQAQKKELGLDDVVLPPFDALDPEINTNGLQHWLALDENVRELNEAVRQARLDAPTNPAAARFLRGITNKSRNILDWRQADRDLTYGIYGYPNAPEIDERFEDRFEVKMEEWEIKGENMSREQARELWLKQMERIEENGPDGKRKPGHLLTREQHLALKESKKYVIEDPRAPVPEPLLIGNKGKTKSRKTTSRRLNTFVTKPYPF